MPKWHSLVKMYLEQGTWTHGGWGGGGGGGGELNVTFDPLLSNYTNR